MESNTLDRSYWNNRWEQAATGWDIGYASPALCRFMEQYPDKNARILIPGCGNAYEAQFLAENGFLNIHLLDIAPLLVSELQKRFQNTPQVKCICNDFFEFQGTYDLIIEQTFFCALDPSIRSAYINQCANLLKPGGLLAGLLFSREFDQAGPPFGGKKEDYLELFSSQFQIRSMEPCMISIPPRQGNELFFVAEKPVEKKEH